MKKILLSLLLFCSALGANMYAATFQPISCSGLSTVTGPNGSAQVSVSNAVLNGASCNACFYAGHIYTGDNISAFFDNFNVSGNMQRLMWQDETWVAWSPINTNFAWGQNLSGSFTFANIGWYQVTTAGANFNRIYHIYDVGQTGIRYVESTTNHGVSLNSVNSGAVPAHRNTPGYVVGFNAASHPYDSTQPSGSRIGSLQNHVQCAFMYPRWCGDGVVDTDHGEQCDNGTGNGPNGTCSSTCQNNQVLACNAITVTPGTLTSLGGTLNASCAGTNATQYKFVLKEGLNTIQTVDYQTASTTSFSIPANTLNQTKNYTVQCYVKNNNASDVTNNPSCIGGSTQGSANLAPQIVIDKRDANSADIDGVVGNDTQTVSVGNAAIFKIRVTNNGTEDLKNLNLSDAVAPNCGGSVTLPGSYPGTWSNFVTAGSGNHNDNILQVGEYFEYTCDKGNTTGNYTNSATVTAQGNTSNIAVTSTDTTPVLVQNTVATCNDLSLSTSGNTVSYNCTGTNASSYSIQLNGSVINSSPNGSTTVGYGTHTFTCYVNGNITSASCQKTVTLTPNQTYPQIQVIKDDADNHDDQQQVNIGGVAQFSVLVRNPGQEPLDTVNLSDQLTPECNRSTSDTVNMIMNTGNRDGRLDPGESFSYICTKSSVNQGTFPNNENRICVNGRGVTSGNAVNSCDTTRINFGTPSISCQDIQVNQNGNQVNVSCSPNGGYRLFVLRGKQVLNTFQNPQGQFSFGLDDGSYKVVCLKDGDNGIQPNCQKNITINPHNEANTCTLSSSVRYGGAPLHTQLNCSSETSSQCTIRINKDGEPWQTLYDCNASMTFNQKGLYEATCYIGDEQESCSTDIQVDIMTIIQTGPFLPLIVIIAVGGAAYITYRRRKTR